MRDVSCAYIRNGHEITFHLTSFAERNLLSENPFLGTPGGTWGYSHFQAKISRSEILA